MRVAIFLVGGAAVAMAIVVKSIYGLWYLCADFVYVILFPQLLCAIHIPYTNVMGSAFGFVLGLFFRLTGGESLLKLLPLIKYPWYDEEANLQYFPFKTLTMLISLCSILIFSLPYYLFYKPQRRDTKDRYADTDGIDNTAYSKTAEAKF